MDAMMSLRPLENLFMTASGAKAANPISFHTLTVKLHTRPSLPTRCFWIFAPKMKSLTSPR